MPIPTFAPRGRPGDALDGCVLGAALELEARFVGVGVERAKTLVGRERRTPGLGCRVQAVLRAVRTGVG